MIYSAPAREENLQLLHIFNFLFVVTLCYFYLKLCLNYFMLLQNFSMEFECPGWKISGKHKSAVPKSAGEQN